MNKFKYFVAALIFVAVLFLPLSSASDSADDFPIIEEEQPIVMVLDVVEGTESPEPMVSETPEPVETETPEPEVVVTDTPAPELTDTPEPITTPTPTATSTPTPTITPEPTPTNTPEPTPTPTPRPVTITKQLKGEIWQVRCDVMDGTIFQAGGGIWKADITNDANTTAREGHRSNHCGDWENWVLFVNENGVATGLYQLKSGSTGGTLPSIVYRPKHDLSKSQIINVDPTNVTDPILNLFKENYSEAMPFSEINLVEGERLWWTSQNGGQMWHHTGVLRKTSPRFAIVINGVPYSLGVGDSITLTDIEDGLVQVNEIATSNYKLHDIQYTDEGDVVIVNQVDDPGRSTPKPPKPLPTVTPTPKPTATPSPTPTATPTLSPTPTPTATPSPTPSPTPTITPSLTPSPSPTPTITPTATPNPSLTPTVTPSPTPTIKPTPTVTPTEVPVNEPTHIPTPTTSITPEPTTPAPTEIETPTPTGIPIASSTPTGTPTPTIATTSTPTLRPRPTATPLPTPKVENGKTWYYNPRHGNWYTIITDYGTPLGAGVTINQAGDCFD